MNNLNVFSYGYVSWRCPITNIKQFFRNIKYAYQRATRGFCEQDVWGLDYFYSELFYQSLNNLADITHGYPGIDIFADTEDNDGFEAWQNYLREMANHFLNSQEWNDSLQVNREETEAYEVLDRCTPNTEAYGKSKLDWLNKVKTAQEFRESEKNKAFNMMSKYFFHLWD